MKRFHQLFGLLIVIIFLLTGLYMDRFLEHLRHVPDGPRMLYRSRHIYILLAGLVNLGIGSYFSPRLETLRRVLQLVGSVLIVIAPLLFLIAFFYEPHLADLHTTLSHWGVYAIAAGTLLHVFSGLGRNVVSESKSHEREIAR